MGTPDTQDGQVRSSIPDNTSKGCCIPRERGLQIGLVRWGQWRLRGHWDRFSLMNLPLAYVRRVGMYVVGVEHTPGLAGLLPTLSSTVFLSSNFQLFGQ